ncbi:MAG: LCP family protein [Eggerthellaceae bacterium]|nr:LCP family protein [Eggerthellaceae bacterium]
MPRNDDNRYSSYRDSSYSSDFDSGYSDELRRRRAVSRRSSNRVVYNEREIRRQEEINYSNNPISIGSPNASLYNGTTVPRYRVAQEEQESASFGRHAASSRRYDDNRPSSSYRGDEGSTSSRLSFDSTSSSSYNYSGPTFTNPYRDSKASSVNASGGSRRSYSDSSQGASSDYGRSTSSYSRDYRGAAFSSSRDYGRSTSYSSRDYGRSSTGASHDSEYSDYSYSSSSASRDYNRSSYGRDRASDYSAYDYQAYSRDSYGTGAGAKSARGSKSSGYSRLSRQGLRGRKNDKEFEEPKRARKARSSEGQSFVSQLPLPKLSRSKKNRVDDIQTADASRYSRKNSEKQYSTRTKKKKSLKFKVIIGVVAVLAILAIAFGGRALAFVKEVSENLARGISSEVRSVLVDTQYKDDPFYMVLLGIDKSDWREDDADFGGSFRTDTMMLARIDPQAKKVTIVSLMRDIRVNLGEHGDHKLNEAYVVGGPECTIQAISNLCGVPISHYAEIDLNGFEAVVDALGGIEVNVPIEINDEEAGGHLDAGMQTLNGWQALIMCRSRHAYDDYGRGDMYRASNQRAVLSAVVQKLLSSDVLTIADTVTTLSEYVTTDISLSDIVGYAQVMRGIDASNDIYTVTAPTGSLYVDGIWYEYMYKDEWVNMMTRINDGLPPTETSETDETGTVLSNAGNPNKEGTEGSEGKANTGTKSRTPVDWSKFNGYNYADYA